MTDAALLVDRFVSSTSATDAHDSVQALLDALKGNSISPETIWDDEALLRALLDVFARGKHGNVPLEEGPSLIGRIYQYLSKQEGSSVLLMRPSPGILMQSLLDVVSNTDESNYVRVLGLQILNSVCTKHPSLAQSQLLEIPNGLHRLADIMREPNDQVRNELLGGVAQVIGKWPSCAKIWVFSEVCDTLMEICRLEGGLNGTILVGDCLDLVESLVDPSLADLIWQSPTFAPKLASLLDLRGGSEFIHPPKLTDDLDDILANKQILPKLTFKEEDIIARVLRILGILLENESTRQQIWKQHAPLCSLVWELALFAPPSGKPVCALPSPKLQQEALEHAGQFFHSFEILVRHNGVDRLLYLVCTGGGAPPPHKMGLSQAALYVLRQSLSPQGRQDILTHSLAPPMDGEPAPTAVTKLLNTVFENLESSTTDLNRRRINLVGALGALGVFMDTPTNREVMLAIAPTLVGALLTSAEKQEDTMVTLALLRFASEWVVETPAVVQAFLASSHSTCLSILLKDESVGAMAGFLLGLCMEYMSSDEEKHGGWTPQSIMESLGKKGGISGYQTILEKFKSADLPWSECFLEKQRFLKWYSALVLVIRRRVVQELTRGGGEDEDGADESNASSKSLNRMVAQQAKELEELRSSLSDANATIESQEGQLAVWKRRVESTPSQLDDMLTEYTRKNVEMEKTVASLRTLMQVNQDSLQAQVQERDNEIAKLQETVRESQERERQAQQERDDLHEELQGVTSAYANLEQEYNQRTQGAAPAGEASRGQPKGQVSHQEEPSSDELASLRAENARLRTDAQAADDWMAMAVQRMNDIGGQNVALQQEVATLREQMHQATLTGGIISVSTGITQQQLDGEQQRREDVEARLVESEAANVKLQEEITVLRQQLEQNVVGAADTAAMEDLHRRLQEEEGRRKEIEAELINSQKDTTTALNSLGEAKSEKEGLERHVASTENELGKARSEIAALLEERHRMEAELVSSKKDSEVLAEATAVAGERDAILASKDAELEDIHSALASKEEELVVLRQELTQARQGLETKAEEMTFLQDTVEQSVQSMESKAEEMTYLQDKVQSLMQVLESVRKELGETTCRERGEIQKRDAKISELESRLTQTEQQTREAGQADAAGFFGSTDGRDEEIEGLRAANDAAQEWMAKAVEHHEMLSEQVTALVDDKAALTKQIKELQLSLSTAALSKPDKATNETVERLERELSQRTDEVTELGARIIKLESKIRVKETEMVNVREKVALCDQLQEQVQLLEDNNVSELETRRSLEDQISQLLSEKENFNEQLSNLRQELADKNKLTMESEASSSDEMESLKNILIEREAELEILRDELETAKDAFADADQLRIALHNAADESSRLKADLDDARSNLTALQGKTALFEEMQAKLQMICDEAPILETDRHDEKAPLDRLREVINSLERDCVSLTSQRDSLRETISEMQTKLDEFEARAVASQQTIIEIQNEKESVERQLISVIESEKDLREQLDTYHEEVAVKSTDLFNVRAELGELMAVKAELDLRLERTQLQNDNLYGKNKSLEQDLKVLEAQHDELLERSNQTEALVKQKDEALRAAQHSVAGLQEILDGLQTQSTGEVNEWKARVEELEATAVEFEETLQKQREEAMDAVNQWSTRYSELETAKSELEEALQNQQEEALDAVNQWSTMYSQLEALKSELEETLQKQQDEASNAVSQWSIRYSELETVKSELEETLQNQQEEALDAVNQWSTRYSELETVKSELEETLQKQQNEASNAVSQWSTRYSELETVKSELEETLQKHQYEASVALKQCSTSYSEIETLKLGIERELEMVSRERDELSGTLERERQRDGKDAVSRIEVDFAKAKADWDADKERLKFQVDELEAAVLVSSQNLDAAEEQVSKMKTYATEIDDTWKDRVSELEALVQELEQSLSHRQEEANEAIARWESHCNALEEKASQLENDLQAVAEQRDELSLNMEKSVEPLRDQLDRATTARIRLEAENKLIIQQLEEVKAQSEEIVNQWKERANELEFSVQELEEELELQQEEATRAISQWESRCSELDEKAAKLVNEQKEGARAISQYETRCSDLEKKVVKLVDELCERSSDDAYKKPNAELIQLMQEVQPLQERIKELETQVGDQALLQNRTYELERALENEQEIVRATKESLASKSELIETLEMELRLLREEVENDSSEILVALSKERAAQDVAEQNLAALKESVSETERALADLQSQEEQIFKGSDQSREDLHKTQRLLEEKESLLNDVIQERDDLKAVVGELQEDLRLLREEVENDSSEILVALSKERAARDVAEQNLAALKESVFETERALADLQSQEEQIFKGSHQSREDLHKTQRLLEEKESLLNDVIQERDDLKAVVGELQEDLRDASDALQACVTDEISEKATEVASHALRYQLEQMCSQLEKDRELCVRENIARLAAEKEAESLRTDLANVLGVTEGHDDPQAQIQRMTMRAAEEIQRRERAEIEELRKALERALKDLTSAQAAERNASANAASSRHQLSVCEQEVISAKSDLAFLTQTLEETRDADASKAASLEYRISSLEDDREVLRRFHADELENLRNELTHVTMEKDRILHSLKESEKKNAAIVFSTSKKGESPEKSSPDAELARLRIEKAQLLSAAAEEGSRAERRIREAVAAQSSSVEADFILERELRATAEAAVEDMKFQIEELKSKAEQESKIDEPEAGMEKADKGSTSLLDQLSADLKRLKEENSTLTTHNAALQKQLEKAKAELSADIVELTEKWRKAQSRAQMLESNVSFDAEVNKEVVKLRATDDVDEDKSEDWIVLTDNPVHRDQGPALSAMDAYDLVHDQKIAIQEERAMYLELLAEHDDLLALLAQQDLEKASLHEALARLAGEEAVDDAMAVAAENAVHQFGKYVKLT